MDAVVTMLTTPTTVDDRHRPWSCLINNAARVSESDFWALSVCRQGASDPGGDTRHRIGRL